MNVLIEIDEFCREIREYSVGVCTSIIDGIDYSFFMQTMRGRVEHDNSSSKGENFIID